MTWEFVQQAALIGASIIFFSRLADYIRDRVRYRRDIRRRTER